MRWTLIIIDNVKRFYKDTPKDKNGWVKSQFYLPQTFDLVEVLTSKKKTYKAWHNGKEWVGYKLEPDSKVLCWRRIYINEIAKK